MSSVSAIPPLPGESGDLADSRIAIAFPTFSPDQIQALQPFGRAVRKAPGEAVWSAGDRGLCMFLVVEGEMSVVDGRTATPVARHQAGGFSGDIDVLSGRPAIVSALASTELELLEIPADCVRSIVGELPAIGEIILRAFLMRRALLLDLKVGPLVFGSRFSADTLRIREFLSRNRLPHAFEDLEGNPDTGRILDEFHVSEADTPVVVCPTGEILRTPTNLALAEALGITHLVEDKVYDLVVIGAGPAGLAAAVYGASEGLDTLVIDAEGPGGQAGTSSRIENYLGFPNGVTGRELANQAVVQAERFGAEMMVPRSVSGLTCTELGGHDIDLEGAARLHSKCVILSPGVRYRRLDADPNDSYLGRGLYYAATNLGRINCLDASIGVVGAGNSAGQAAVFLSETCKRVYLVVRGDDLRKSMSSYLALRIEHSPKIEVLLNSEVATLEGEPCLEHVGIRDRKSGTHRVEPIRGLFVMIGAAPNTAWLPESVARDEKGFILTGSQLQREGKWKYDRPPFYLETSCAGVFAAGDARAGSVKRVASAVGEGSMAVAFVHQFLAL